MDHTWQHRIDSLAKQGLNTWGVVDGTSHQTPLEGCRSIVVFGSGGTQLWNALLDDLQAHPCHLTDKDHPLDAFVSRAIHAVDPEPGSE